MKEQVFNLYAIVEDEIIRKVALKSHMISGSDEEKNKFLRDNAEKDFKESKLYNVPENYVIMDLFDEKNNDMVCGIPYEVYKKYIETGNAIGIYELAFIDNNAPMRPFVNYSVVKDDRIIMRHD